MTNLNNALPGLATFFNTLCDAAAQETLPRFRTSLDVSNKLDADFDPVTEADREAERAIRTLISARYQDHGIIGEEHGASNPQADFQWVIDPIDGTRAFISGIPVWGTLIGLYYRGKPIAGAMDQPFTGERYTSVEGRATLQRPGSEPQAISTSATPDISHATLMTTSPHLFVGAEERAYKAVESRVKLFRYGCDCYAYCLLAAGHVDIVIESGLHIYDIAALIPIVEGAGGVVTSWTGGDAAQGGTVLAAANAQLHAQAFDLINSA